MRGLECRECLHEGARNPGISRRSHRSLGPPFQDLSESGQTVAPHAIPGKLEQQLGQLRSPEELNPQLYVGGKKYVRSKSNPHLWESLQTKMVIKFTDGTCPRWIAYSRHNGIGGISEPNWMVHGN